MKESWEIKKLGEVYDVRDGTHDSPKYQSSGYPLITSKNLKDGELNFDKVKFISKEDYININKRSKVDIGDVLFAMIGTIGNPAVIIDQPEYAIKNVALFKVGNDNQSLFLKYYLDSKFVQDKMAREAKGTTQKFVGLGYLRNFPIPIPPLPEQKAIVAILDKAFAAIDNAKANIEKNIENAKELFQSKLNEIFSQKGDGWEEKKLKDSVEFISTGPFGSLLHKSDYVSKGIPLVNPINMIDGKIVPDERKQVTSTTLAKLKNYKLLAGDVVVARRGEIGRCAFVGEKENGWLCGTGSFFIRPNGEILSKFIVNLLNTKYYRDKLESASTGATMLNISNKTLSNLIVIYPSPKEQEKIIEQIDKIKTLEANLETKFEHKLTNLEELKKSILQKAFAGELTN